MLKRCPHLSPLWRMKPEVIFYPVINTTSKNKRGSTELGAPKLDLVASRASFVLKPNPSWAPKWTENGITGAKEERRRGRKTTVHFLRGGNAKCCHF